MKDDALIKSEQRFHNIINRSLDGILILSMEGKILFVNPAAEQLFDSTSETLCGAEFGFPVFAGDTSEIEILSKQKQFRIVEMCVTDTYWDGAEALLLELRDITGRKEAEMMLRLNERRLESMLKLNQMYQETKESMIQFALSEAVSLTGSTIGLLAFVENGNALPEKQWYFSGGISGEIQDLFIKSSEIETKIFSQAITTGKPVISNSFQLHLPGEYPAVRNILCVPIPDDESTALIAAVGNKNGEYSHLDITQLQLFMEGLLRNLKRHAAENALKESEEKFRGVVQQSHDGIILMDEKGTITEWNMGMSHITGYSREESLGQTRDYLLKLLPEDTITAEMAENFSSLDQIPGAKKHANRLEIEIINKEHQKKIVQISGFRLQTREGTLLCIIFKDVTDVNQYEEMLIRTKEEAETANKAKSEFLAKMSHEIRTPMNGILGMTELALQTELTEKQREYIEMVDDSAKALLILINDILDISRIEAGKMELKEHKFEIRRLAEKIIQALQHVSDTKGLSLTCRIDKDVPDFLFGDSRKLRQILFNLLGNAVKYTSRGSCSLHISRNTGSLPNLMNQDIPLLFRISDTGIGISPEGQETLFGLFTQIDNSYSRNFEGAGLGLAISKQLVEMMGGKIWFQSEPGIGSTFSFSIVLRKTAAGLEQKTVEQEKPLQEITDPLNILVVDDNEINRKVFSAFLKKLGHRVHLAPSGEKGIQAAGQNHYDLILMDIEMPGISGLEAAAHIRNHSNHTSKKHVPIIAVTAHALKGDKEFFLSSGMDGYLSKPISMKKLKEVLCAHSEPQDIIP